MAIKFLTSIDLNGNELQNGRLQNLATAPPSPTAGRIYFDTTLSVVRIYDGSEWKNLFSDDDDFHTLPSETVTDNADEILIYDVSAGAYRRQSKSNFIAGTGGEANTGSNQGVGGVPVFIQKNGVDLEFRSINGASSKITVAQDDVNNNVDIDVDPSAINHSEINDDEPAKHRLINDSGTLSTELWSANKITSELSGKSDTTHNHNGTYEPVDATILREADVDDTPANGATAAPVSSNWAYNHSNAANPHAVTKADVGLSNVTNEAQIPLSQKGVANGVASLDGSGLVPASQLPSYVDDVLSSANKAALVTDHAPFESNKIYLAQDTNIIYRWDGTGNLEANLIEISESLALGETSSTAYRGDRGAIAYNHSQAAHAPADAIQASDVTYENLNANGDVGTGASQVAAGDHTHAGFPQKYAVSVGDGASTSIVVNHNLNSRDVVVTVYDASTPYSQVMADVEMTTVNSVTVTFAVAPSSNQYRVVVIG